MTGQDESLYIDEINPLSSVNNTMLEATNDLVDYLGEPLGVRLWQTSQERSPLKEVDRDEVLCVLSGMVEFHSVPLGKRRFTFENAQSGEEGGEDRVELFGGKQPDLEQKADM